MENRYIIFGFQSYNFDGMSESELQRVNTTKDVAKVLNDNKIKYNNFDVLDLQTGKWVVKNAVRLYKQTFDELKRRYIDDLSNSYFKIEVNEIDIKL